jgi:hypothetical protein
MAEAEAEAEVLPVVLAGLVAVAPEALEPERQVLQTLAEAVGVVMPQAAQQAAPVLSSSVTQISIQH